MKSVTQISIALGMLAAHAGAVAQQRPPVGSESRDRFYIPPTVSPEAAAALKAIYASIAAAPPLKEPSDLAGFDALSAQYDAAVEPLSAAIIKEVGGQVRKDELGGVTVYRVRSANYRPNTAPLIYVHGGGWVAVSAKASVGDAALYAANTGREVIAVEYTLAPRVDWRTITDQVIAVWKALIAQGHDPKRMGLCGVSAGGNIILGSTLKMRDQGLPLPGAIVTMSPAADVAFEGDTSVTLGDRDPTLDRETIRWFAKAYLGGSDPRNPYVSPVHGDYRKAFPPTLIQVGTRELLLSSAVREYQAIRSGGNEAVLDVYEGMPHGFPLMLWSAPEGRTVYKRAGEFFRDRLDVAQTP